MQTLLRRIKQVPLRPYTRVYSVASTRSIPSRSKTLSVIDQLEQDGARILRTVQTRVEERDDLVASSLDDISSPEDITRAKRVKELEPLKMAWDEWQTNRQLLRETIPLLNDLDPTMRALASDEYTSLIASLSHSLSRTFPSLLVPPSPTIHMSALLELKSGVGGSEASLFLGDLLRVYLRYAQVMKWKAEIVEKNESDGGGVRDAIVEVKGVGAYDGLKWESGVHRVQRVPATESKGRVHTSTITAVVLPLAEEDAPEDELFSMDDVRVEVMRARGAGGQHVNKTESAVRLTHRPSGITVSMQDERSQHQNRRRAFQILRARLMDRKLTQDLANRRAERRDLVQTADRSAKIRTYNYVQERVTDHRLGLSLMNLTTVMEEDGLHEFIDAMQRNHDESVMEEIIQDS
ncbi:hypothetical protein PILCRDRAFT_827528 [Piloderma croceum F 1598]|uniref:Prokaryotic-type class I peptide chain release factors domain-containing protein n=1 Tax=Piloderma croceum (strain F 1598) TaxID=765440 RepID=A0A0C3BCW9_PILCF|nr:hypothetical protein PILCRDRAFT_827528 [Piloderma croceum F 1598]